jgi:flagellar motor switch/type III secretory pathway protein FliN
MNRIATLFARGARRTLPFLVWRKSHLVPQAVSIAAAPGERPTPTGPSLHATYDDASSPAWAAVSLNDVSLGLILEGALGGAESKESFKFGKELTLAQRALAGRLVKALGEDLSKSLRQELGMELTLSGVYAGPNDSLDHVHRPDGLTVECIVEGVPGAVIGISVQAAALEAASREPEIEDVQQGDPRMHQIVQDVPVQVIAELGRIELGLRSVLELKVGQVLRLSTAVDDPVRVDVAGLKKFIGVPVVSRGQLAVEVRGRCGD